MLPHDQDKLFALVTDTLAAYAKVPTAQELGAWWATCRMFTLHDVERSLAAHQMDNDDGKRAPRPIDVKRRLVSGAVERPRTEDPHFAERLEAYRLQAIRSPAVVACAHAIALRHGNRPWQGSYAAAKSASDVVESG